MAELWKSIGEQGWLAVTIDEQHDGLGLGLLDAAVLARCWGEGCAPGPFLPTLVATEAIRLGGTDAQKTEWLPRVATGDAKLTPAVNGRVTASNDALTGELRFVELNRRRWVRRGVARGRFGGFLVFGHG